MLPLTIAALEMESWRSRMERERSRSIFLLKADAAALPAPPAPTASLSYAERLLEAGHQAKRAREGTSRYRRVSHVAATVNTCERLFSQAYYIFASRKDGARNIEHVAVSNTQYCYVAWRKTHPRDHQRSSWSPYRWWRTPMTVTKKSHPWHPMRNMTKTVLT